MVKSVRMWWLGGMAACVAVAALAIVALSGGGLAHGRTASVQKTAAPLTPEEWQQLTNNTNNATPTVQITPTGNVACASATSEKVSVSDYQFQRGDGTPVGLSDPTGQWNRVTNVSVDPYTTPVTLPAPSSGTGYDQVQTTGTDCSGQSVTETTPPIQVGNGSVSGVNVPSAPQNANLSVFRIQGQTRPTAMLSWSPPSSLASCTGGPASNYLATLESSRDGSSNWVPVHQLTYAHSGQQVQLFSYTGNSYFRLLVSLATPCGQAGPAATSNVVDAAQFL